MSATKLIKRYNIPVPRYTSYPTVPFWKNNINAETEWVAHVSAAFQKTNKSSGVSIYVHLPYCESLCTFCGCNKRITKNHKVEEPYIETVLREWEMYLQFFGARPKIKEIHFGGGTPTFFAPHSLKRLVNGLTNSADIDNQKEFGFEAHPNSTTERHLEILSLHGFKRLSLGIQDFDPKVQVMINRVQTFEKVEEVTKNARRYGYGSINFDLLYGLPFQRKTSIVDTFEKVMRLMPERIAFYSYAHVPWKSKGQRRYTEADIPDNDEKRRLYETGREMLEKAGYVEIGMDHFALKTDGLYKAMQSHTLHRNFMGYTTGYNELLIGLGASAISDTWDAFIQNEKDVDAYQQAIGEGRLPIYISHRLSIDEQTVRRHVLNLMCNMQTTWDTGIKLLPYSGKIIEKLRPMADDGLIELTEQGMKVTEKGKPFIRNICSALDASFHESAPKEQMFSKSV